MWVQLAPESFSADLASSLCNDTGNVYWGSSSGVFIVFWGFFTAGSNNEVLGSVSTNSGDFGVFLGCFTVGPCSSSVLESVSTNPGDFGAFLGPSNLGDFGFSLGCHVFLTFFPALVTVFFPWLDPDVLLAFCFSLVSPDDPVWPMYFCSACSSSSNRVKAWILFGLISTITSCSGKCQSNHLSLIYFFHCCILAT